MPHPRFDKLPQEKRTRILEAAARLFGQKGYEDTSVAAVLAEAGISKGAAYYYFEDKADLFETVVYHFLRALEAQMGIPEASTDPEAFWLGVCKSIPADRESFWLGVRLMYRRSMEIVEEIPWMVGLFRACLMFQGHPTGPVEGMRRRSREWVQRSLQFGQRCDAIRTDIPDDLLVDLALAIDQTLDMWMAKHLDHISHDELAAALDRYPDCLRRVLEPRTAPRS